MTPDTQSQPTSNVPHEIALEAGKDGRITNVNVYSHRAEVTRALKVTLEAGQNNVAVKGLPVWLNDDSLRVEGRGNATIHDVTIVREAGKPIVKPIAAPTTSPKVQELRTKQDQLSRTFERYTHAANALESYLASLTAEHLPVDKLSKALDVYIGASEILGKKMSDVGEQLKVIAEQLVEEGEPVTLPTEALVPPIASTLPPKATKTVTVGVVTEMGGEVEMVLTYAVQNASWVPSYEVRAQTGAEETAMQITYKAKIQQHTGEDWNNVPITLQTAAPSFGLDLPKLTTWTLSVEPSDTDSTSYKRKRVSNYGEPTYAYQRYSPRSPRYSPTSPRFSPASPDEERSRSRARTPQIRAVETMAAVNTGVNASFKVPGLVNIPSDNVAHSVTIAALTPEAKHSWLAAPKLASNVHLTSSVKNTSEYTLLAGPSNVYVDGVFISKSKIPLVSPQETFTCALGLDPSIRITYHPLVKKGSESGLLTRTKSTSFTQRITVHNTRPTESIENLKILDQIPVSQDSQISVKLVSPPLPAPGGVVTPVNVAFGINAQWHVEDSEAGEDGAGKDGKIAWICSLPAQKKVELSLVWEVAASTQTSIQNLGWGSSSWD